MMALKMKQVILRLRIITYKIVSLFSAVGEAVKKTFQDMVDVKLLQRVNSSTVDTQADAAVTKYQLPPSEGDYWTFHRVIHM